MANPDRPIGFRPRKTKAGTVWTGGFLRAHSPAADRSSDTTNNHGDLYVGDPITISTAGAITPADSSEACDGVVIAVAADGDMTFGQKGGVQEPTPLFDPTDLTKRYLAASEAGWVFYVPTDGMLFEVQSASDLDLEVGSLADITNAAATAHGSRSTGLSSCEITTASNNDVRVAEMVIAPDNDSTLANTRYLVEFINRTSVPA